MARTASVAELPARDKVRAASLMPAVPREVATLRTLRIAKHFPFFLAVAEEQNLHRAAERLNIAQSALSRRIADLERELGGVELFERQARGVAITRVGQVLAQDVRRILMSIEDARRNVRLIADGDRGTLRVAFSEAMLRRPVLPVVLREFRALYPSVELRAFPLTSDAQRSRLLADEVDVAFVIDEAGDADQFERLAVGQDRFQLVLPEDHPLAAKPSVQLHEIAGEALLWPARHISPRLFDRMMGAFDARGVSPNIAVEVAAVDIAYELVGARIGLGVVTAARSDRTPPGVVLRELSDLDIVLPISMLWPKGSNSPLIARFTELVRHLLNDEH
ncbi:LysR family transcriptional regulator [Sphingomonas jatrophae]|uniref:Transcriptional regulator, LysR family n=1 Tax=Sphingomonas jatrophae TaxID=1166337 RepID=A0A1I6M4T3_9SPHN|nr:LysR family transcriptional regulator [Sphingomonas jatrophae]SFS10681.1 transcriptional regulator, LysR family [Sphingomonas jatrophae]